MNHQPEQQPKEQKLNGKEVAKHNNKHDCWVIIHGRVFDVTEFMPEHPGINNTRMYRLDHRTTNVD